MRKVILFISVVLLVACGETDTSKPEVIAIKDSITVAPTYGVVSTSFYNAKLKAYQQFLTTLDTAALESNTKALTQLKISFMGESAATCDTAYTLFETFNNKLLQHVDSKLRNDYGASIDSLMSLNENGLPITLSMPLQQLKQRITSNGFMLQMDEGVTYVVTDRGFTVKQLSSMLSPIMVTFLTQLQKEDIEVFESDASLMLKPKFFVDRVIWYEIFLAKNPQFMYATFCANNLRSYTSVLIGATVLDNTRFYNGDDKTISDYFEQALVYLNKQYPQSQANKVAQPIYQAIKAGQIDKAKQLQDAYKKTVAM